MKLVKTASGKQTIKMSKKEWTNIGKKAGWMKTAIGNQHKQPFGQGDARTVSPLVNKSNIIKKYIEMNKDIINKIINYRFNGDPSFDPIYDESDMTRESKKIWKQLQPLFSEFKEIYSKTSDHNPNKEIYKPLYQAIIELEDYISNDSDIGHVFHDLGLELFIKHSNLF
jgi:hypothetical protein